MDFCKTFTISILLLFYLLSDLEAQLSPNQPPVNLDPVDPQRESFFQRFNYFDLELFKIFGDEPMVSNIFISPASIKVTLALIYPGTGGESAHEIADVLRIHELSTNYNNYLSQIISDLNSKSAGASLESANAVFVNSQLPLNPRYEQIARQNFRATVQKLNFSQPYIAARQINQWAAGATHQMIQEIVSPTSLNAATSVLIANALFFKGKWKTAFNRRKTRVDTFSTPSGKKIEADFMYASDFFEYNYITELDAEVVNLPYEGDQFAMLLVAPRNGNVRTLARDLQHTHLTRILAQLSSSEIVLNMPKFDIEYEADLVDKLRALKIQAIFGPHANLSGITGHENVRIDGFVHKTRVEVNEEGTKAAAVTVADVVPLTGSSPPEIMLNKPFIFFIYQVQTKNIIFGGVLVEPNASRIVSRQKPLGTTFLRKV